MQERDALTDFLVTRRAQVNPADVGLPAPRTRRRSKGLRREEVAAVTGLSLDYYSRLEQHRLRHVPEHIIAALARCLLLDDHDEVLLRELLQTPPMASIVTLPTLAALGDALNTKLVEPALVVDDALNILFVNDIGRALFESFDPAPHNLARWVFLNPVAQQRLLRWDDIAGTITALLQRQRQNAATYALIGELSARSAIFTQLWSRRQSRQLTSMYEPVSHPQIGTVGLRLQVQPVFGGGRSVIIMHPAPGSPTEDKLRLLASWTAHPCPSPR
jgi:transcriptional regulator with XRE-family HTH domain